MATTTKKMPSFQYEGIDRKGFKAKGDISAKNLALAKISLRKQGIDVRKISQKHEIQWFNKLRKKKITTMDITVFTRQLVTMIKAGVPLVQGFEIVAEGLDNPAMRDLVLGIKTDVEAGNTFAGALRKYPQYFDDLFCSLVASGEQSGSLENMLERVALHKEKSELLKQKISKALKYPITIIVIAVIVSIILMVKVVPVFQDLFSSFGAELPALTRYVVSMSEWMQKYWFFLILFIGISIFLFVQFKKKNKKFSDALERFSLKLPVFGNLIFKSIVARFSRTLATTFAAGVPLIDALESTAAATNNCVFENAVLQIRDEVATGQQLQFAMRQTQLFPSMAIQLVSIGEESGSLDSMLEKVAIYYENEVDLAVDGLTSMMEPMIMAILGVLVGGLVIAMYLPIFQMGSIV